MKSLSRVLAFGICGPVTAVLLMSCGGKDPDPGSPAGSAPTAAPTSAPPTSVPVTSTPDTSSTATITAPVQGSTVQQCAIVTGTAKLAPGRSLVTAMRNMDNGDATHYFEPVSNWQVPAQLATWTAKQYFGSGDSSAGQRYAIELYSADTATIDDGFASGKPTWTAKQVPATLTLIARVEVKRVKGKGPVECQ